uniref:FXSXX-COOH protein n=1 Tax=Streptomyces sp. NBC_00003 TaxID=2903608 RepID=A0AAU2VEI4_9ACTN
MSDTTQLSTRASRDLERRHTRTGEVRTSTDMNMAFPGLLDSPTLLGPSGTDSGRLAG